MALPSKTTKTALVATSTKKVPGKAAGVPRPELTPAEKKARLKAAAAKKALMQHKAPTDMKPFFMEVKFATAKDGLFDPRFDVQRVRGRWDNEEAKRFNMSEYDPVTVTAFMSRISAMLFAPNPERRLTPNTSYHMVVRVAANKATGFLACRFVAAKRTILKDGKPKWAWFTKEKHMDNPDFKKLRRCVRNAAGAFTKVLLPPTGRQAKSTDE